MVVYGGVFSATIRMSISSFISSPSSPSFITFSTNHMFYPEFVLYLSSSLLSLSHFSFLGGESLLTTVNPNLGTIGVPMIPDVVFPNLTNHVAVTDGVTLYLHGGLIDGSVENTQIFAFNLKLNQFGPIPINTGDGAVPLSPRYDHSGVMIPENGLMFLVQGRGLNNTAGYLTNMGKFHTHSRMYLLTFLSTYLFYPFYLSISLCSYGIISVSIHIFPMFLYIS